MSTPFVQLTDSVFVITTRQCYEKIPKHEIFYIQAERAWVDIVTKNKTYRLSTNLGQLESQLHTDEFCRISRKHIVNLNQITAVQGGQLFVGDRSVLIGKQYREALISRLPILRTKVDRGQ